jgi:hypothetical protein
MKFFFSISLIALVVLSCSKYEGPGGKASITGTIQGNKFDGAGNLLTTYPMKDHDVYLIYGNESGENFYDDDISTSYDGSFEFTYLAKGNYRLFTSGKCPSCPGGDSVLIYNIEITDKKEVVDLGTINIRD